MLVDSILGESGERSPHSKGLLLLLAVVFCTATPAHAVKRLKPSKNPYRKQWAIVIGINYSNREDAAAEGVSELKNAQADAAVVAESLKKYYGYEDDAVRVLIGKEATKEAIARVLGDAFLCDPDTVKAEDSVLVFFAGHGDRRTSNDRTRAVLWPYDVKTIDGKGVDSSSCIRINNVLEDLELCAARHKLLILDSCHSGEVFKAGGLTRSSGRFKFDQEIFDKPVIQAIAASRGFQKANDGDEHSPFTLALLESLHGGVNSSSFGASALFSRIPERVKEMSNQRPRGGTISGDGEFYFFRQGEPEKLDLSQYKINEEVEVASADVSERRVTDTSPNDAPTPTTNWLLCALGGGLPLALVIAIGTILLARRNRSAQPYTPSQPTERHAGPLPSIRARAARDVTMDEGAVTKCCIQDTTNEIDITCIFAAQTDIGRSDECGLVLPHRQVSSRHARLRYVEADDQFVVEDLGSRNGTYLVGRKVSEDQVLTSGTQIQLGQSAKLTFNQHQLADGRTLAELTRHNSADELVSRYFMIPNGDLPLSQVDDDAPSDATLFGDETGVFYREISDQKSILLAGGETLTKTMRVVA